MKSILCVLILCAVTLCVYATAPTAPVAITTESGSTPAPIPMPVVTGIHLANSMTRDVAQKVIINGRNFVAGRITVMIGTFDCIHVQRISDKEIHCTVAGHGANAEVVVTVNGQSSASVASNPTAASAVRFDFATASSNGLQCVPPFGAADVINGDRCNCWSSYAPSDASSTDCNVHAVCAGKVTSANTVAQYAPGQPTISFADDTLTIMQTQPIVKGRRDSIIQFVVPNLASYADDVTPQRSAGDLAEATCFYPNNIWTKTVNQLDCLDQFTATMPWSQHSMCAFVEYTGADVPANKRVYKSVLQHIYTETYMNDENMLTFRKMIHTYMVSVSFDRSLVAVAQAALTVEIAPPTVAVEIISDAVYDVATHKTFITFRTISDWPYTISSVNNGAWSGVGSITATPSLDSAPACTTDVLSDCEQIWNLEIDAGSVCDLAGSLSFTNNALQCRDIASMACPAATTIDFSIAIGHTDVCDTIAAAEASAGLASTLTSFVDQELTLPQSAFEVGELVYFVLTINNPMATIDMATVNSISVATSAGGVSYPLYTVGSPSAAGSNMNVSSEVRSMVAAGQPATILFQFRLSRALSVLGGINSGDSTAQVLVTAVVDLFYHGNQKRTVEVSSTASTSHTQLSIYQSPQAAQDLADGLPLASVVGDDVTTDFDMFSSASTVMTSAVVLAAAAVAAMM